MNDLLKNLKTAIFSVLEKMYFLLPDEPTEGTGGGEARRTVYVGITGAKKNYLVTLSFDERLVAGMTSDLLGIEQDEVTGDLMNMCLCETANVIAGRILLDLPDKDARDITIPSVTLADVFATFSPAEEQEMNFTFNGYPAKATFTVGA